MNASTEKIDYLEAELQLVPTGDSGRKTPIRSGYMPNFWIPQEDSRELVSAGIKLVEGEELSPGASGLVRIYPFAPELWHDVHVGTKLEMTEGGHKTLGIATVTRVVSVLVPIH
jgi:hypothetical protein